MRDRNKLEGKAIRPQIECPGYSFRLYNVGENEELVIELSSGS